TTTATAATASPIRTVTVIRLPIPRFLDSGNEKIMYDPGSYFVQYKSIKAGHRLLSLAEADQGMVYRIAYRVARPGSTPGLSWITNATPIDSDSRMHQPVTRDVKNTDFILEVSC